MSIETSESIKAIMPAILAFQGETEGVKRDAANPHFKSRYASLEAVIDYARPVLQRHGLVFIQAPGRIIDGALEVTTRIVHAESGEWQESTMHIPLGKKDPQGAGSALTYAQRYSLMAALGLPPTDDDGEAAIDRENKRVTPDVKPPENRRAVKEEAERQASIADTLIEAMAFSRNVESLQAWKRDEWQHIKPLAKPHFDRVVAAYKAREAALMAGEPVNYLEAGE